MRWLAFFVALVALAIQALFRFSIPQFALLHLHLSAVQIGIQVSVYFGGLLVGYLLMTLITAFAGTRWGLSVALLGSALASAAMFAVPNFIQFLAIEFVFAFFAAGVFPALIQAVRELFPATVRPGLIALILFTTSAPSFLASALVTNFSLAWLSIPLFLAAILTAILWSPPLPADRSGQSSSDLTPSIVAVGALVVLAICIVPLNNNWFVWLHRLSEEYSFNMRPVGLAISLSTGLAVMLAGGLATVCLSVGLSASKTRAVLLTTFGCLVPVGALSGLLPHLSSVPFCLTAVGFQASLALLYWGVADALPARSVCAGAAIGSFVLNLSGWVYSTAAGAIVQRFAPSAFAHTFLPALGALAAIGVLSLCLMAWLGPAEPLSKAAAGSDPAAMAAFR